MLSLTTVKNHQCAIHCLLHNGMVQIQTSSHAQRIEIVRPVVRVAINRQTCKKWLWSAHFVMEHPCA